MKNSNKARENKNALPCAWAEIGKRGKRKERED